MKTTDQAGAERKNHAKKRPAPSKPAAKKQKKPSVPQKKKAKGTRPSKTTKPKKTVPSRRIVRTVSPAARPHSGQQGGRLSTRWHPVFIKALGECPNITRAAGKANISRQTAFEHKKRIPQFAAAWEDAIEQGCESLETAAYIRGVEGIPRSRSDKDGNVIEEWREYSDVLLALLMKGRLPKIYRDKVEHSGAVTFVPLDEEEARLRQLEKEGAV